MIKVKRKPKYKSKTPIVFAVPAHQKKLLREVPRLSIRRFKEGIADSTDWYNTTFRMKVAYELTVEGYELETQMALKDVLDLLLSIKDRRSSDSDWQIKETELEVIEAGADAMDQLEDETTRRVQLDAAHKAQAYMKQFVGYKI